MLSRRGSGRWLSRARYRRIRRRVVVGAATAAAWALVLGSVAANAAPPQAPKIPKPNPGVAVTGLTPVPHKSVKGSAATRTSFRPARTAWPKPASGTLALAAPRSAARAAGARSGAPGTPVWAQAVADGAGRYQGPSSLGVQVQPRSLAESLGISGVVWSLAPDASTAAGSVRVGLDYSSFSQAIGGNYALRLHLVQLPACALTTPQVPACRVQTPLASLDDAKAGSLSALVKLARAAAPVAGAGGARGAWDASATYTDGVARGGAAIEQASTSGSATVIAATDSTGQEGGGGGTYAATGLSSAGSWSGGGSSGDFTYTYGVAVPGASTSLAPDASLYYDSGSVDGKTANTQAQSSWVGDGWTTQDSYIAQNYVPCDDDPEGSAGTVTTTDECYDGQILTLSLNGSSTAIVYDAGSGTYRLADDNGATVTHVTGANNGVPTHDTDYWVITERNGASYYFGRNQLPGWSSGDAVTNSVDYERVYAAHSSDPCYNATASDSYCVRAYQWHLDYVTTLQGAAMAYYYNQDFNYYGAYNGADNGSSSVQYVRDSHLDHVDYGFTTATGPFGTVPDKVVYGTGGRCVATDGSCGSGETSGNAASYPDVPYDLICAAGATCSAYAPAFFSTARLTSITTQQYSTAVNGYVTVDSYALTQTEPNTGDATSATLWLQQIQHTGNDTTAGGSSGALSTNPVVFDGSALENRVDTTVYPGMFRYRITKITNELGGTIGVTYTLPNACSTTVAPSSNTGSCFPVYWTPSGYAGPMLDWFNKYAVQQVQETDTTGGSATKQTDYSYQSPAWHYDDDETVKPKYRTYGQWRGYQQVTTTTGNGTDPKTKQVTSYYQGMDGDYLSPTSTRSVALTDSQGGTHTDSNALQGKVLESATYFGDGSDVDHSTIYSYWVSAATATRTRSGLPDLTAHMTGTAEAWTRQRLTDQGSIIWRQTETDTTYDATATDPDFGLPRYSYAHTVPVNTAYDRCSATAYVDGKAGLNLIGLVAGTETDSVACSGFTENASYSSVPSALNTLGAPANVNRPDQVVSASQTFYDDPTFSGTQPAPPTLGQPTMTRQAVTYSGGAFVWRTTAQKAYDGYGRVTALTDGNGNTTTTAYTMDAAYLTTGQSVTAPTVAGVAHVTSATLDPERGLTLTATDVNGVVTTTQYDALGRVTSVWLDSRTTNMPANYTYAYTVSNTGLSGVVTNTLNDNSSYLTSVTIDDALGRTRQTQTYTPQGGRLINDTLYDSRGLVSKRNNDYWDQSTTPTLTPLDAVPDKQVPNQDDYTYDGLGRIVYDTSQNDANVVSTTTTVYTGDATTVIPPAGGVTKTTWTDPLGRTSETDEYSTAPTLTTPADPATGLFYITSGTPVATTYGYDGHGRQSTTTDAKGEVWTSVYDLAGEAVSKSDPTAGTSTMTYDADGNLLQTQDARGDYVSYTYDALNRKTAQYAAATSAQAPYLSTTAPGNQSAAWIYDNTNHVTVNSAPLTYPIGHVTTETSYSGGYAYTTQSQGFNPFGESLGEATTIPATTQVGTLAKTWKITHAYSTVLGLHDGDNYPLGGGLPSENVSYGYNNDNQFYGAATNAYTYVSSTTYTAYGQVSAVQYGPATGSFATATNSYDPHTGRLTDQLVTRSITSPGSVDDTTYTYDPADNITQQTETRLGSAATSETQCFAYDPLDRLTDAWTATDACATAPTASAHSQVGDGITSGAYWNSWSFDTVGNRQTQTQHAITGGSDTTTSYTYNGNTPANQPNTLTSTSTTGGATGSTSYQYDPAGNTTTRSTALGTQNLTWNNAGQLTQVNNTTTSSNTNYIYDADGNLLLQIDPNATTLYLGSEQFTYTQATGTVTGVRYYPVPGGGTVVRTGIGSNYDFEIADQHGTNTLALDSTGQTPTWRQYDPYGNPRGTTTTWLDNRTFLNKPTDTATGLTAVGARYYDPVTGRFISLDPVLEHTDTLALNGYSYTDGNPITQTDPTGQQALTVGGGGSYDGDCAKDNSCGDGVQGTHGGCGTPGFIGPCALPAAAPPTPTPATHRGGLAGFWDGVVDTASSMVTSPVKQWWSDVQGVGGCFTGNWGNCGHSIIDFAGDITQGNMALGLIGTGYSIFQNYRSGQIAYANGQVFTFAATAWLLKGRAVEGEASALESAGLSNRLVPDPPPQLKPSGVPNRASAVYISIQRADGTIETVGSKPGGLHAEDVAQGIEPGGQMSRPFGWRRDAVSGELTWQPINVCVVCQPKFPPTLFPPGTIPDAGGAWGY